MSYMDIDNLYKNRDILLFRECYAMEKIHGTSAHISWKKGQVSFFAGGCKHETFIDIFDLELLTEKFEEIGVEQMIVYGEAYGGKIQKMRDTYGEKIRFVVFEVKIGESWLAVPQAQQIALQLGLDFVSYRQIPTTLEALDKERNTSSEQAITNGCGTDKMREGIVLRPLIEVKTNNNKRVIAKYKCEEFRETATPRKVSKDKLKVLQEANDIADEWVTEMRLTHVLDAFPDADITKTGLVIRAMVDDILKEAKDEIMESREVKKRISQKTALMFKRRISKI